MLAHCVAFTVHDPSESRSLPAEARGQQRAAGERGEVVERDAQGPDGYQHHLEDTIVLVRRVS